MFRIAGMMLTCALMLAAVPATAQQGNDELFQSLGGSAGISRVVDDFMVIWQADPRIRARLADADLPHLGAMLKEQIGQLSGGPVAYTGKSMQAIHDGLNIRNAEFNAVAEDLQTAMDKSGISPSVQNRLLAKLAPMQRDIVGK